MSVTLAFLDRVAAVAARPPCREVSRRVAIGRDGGENADVRIACPDDASARHEARRIGGEFGRAVYDRSYRLNRKTVARYSVFREGINVDVVVGGTAAGSYRLAEGA